MKTLSIQQSCDVDFIRRVEEVSEQKVSKCYQCGNCIASCAYTFVYDYPVNQIMRLIQLGQKEVVLKSSSIWLCANCQACTTRCPVNLDVTRIMETLRIMSRQEGTVSEPDIRTFYDEFLKSVKTFGRVFETGLLPVYNLRNTRMDISSTRIRELAAQGLSMRYLVPDNVLSYIVENELYRKGKLSAPTNCPGNNDAG